MGAARFEHDLLNYVHKMLALNVLVLIVVQLSLRRKTNKALWVHKWIRMAHVPFFYQTCSCKTGDCVPGCHLTYYVGSNRHVDLYPCIDVPTYSPSQLAGVNSLGGTIKHLCSLPLARYAGTALEHVSPAGHPPAICPPCNVLGQCKGSADTRLNCLHQPSCLP